MKYKSLNFITNYLTDTIHREADDILMKLSKDYDIDYNTLKKKYINNNNISYPILEIIKSEEDIIKLEESVKTNIKTNIKNTIDCNIRCLGIIKSGAQCARTRKNNAEYCLIHQKSLKFGKIHISNQM